MASFLDSLGITPGDPLLAGVSGGTDSMVMLQALLDLGHSVTSAHCNFQLRGREADLDEQLVMDFCLEKGVPFRSVRFDTLLHARDKGISVQMAARDLRYNWFEKLATAESCNWILVAHHADDQVETLLMNLTRGTGLRGLTGIPAVNGRIIRPLLRISRREIDEFRKLREVPFRDDESNSSTKYHRNRIRHQVIPQLEMINPSLRETLTTNMEVLERTMEFVSEQMTTLIPKLTTQAGDDLLIPIATLNELASREFVLYEILRDKGFSPAQVRDIIASLEAPPGRLFYTKSHRLLKDRGQLVVSQHQEDLFSRFYLDPEPASIDLPIPLSWQILTPGETPINPDPKLAFLDYDRLSWPLLLRTWREGDRFHPLGMSSSKKLSDFFIDQKLGIHDKDRTWILESAGEIAWIAGHRIDDRFKVTPETTRIVRFEIGASPSIPPSSHSVNFR